MPSTALGAWVIGKQKRRAGKFSDAPRAENDAAIGGYNYVTGTIPTSLLLVGFILRWLTLRP